jgi:hypothetical protein
MRGNRIRTKTMKRKILLIVFSAWFIPSWSFAATIPAGTTLLVRTNQTISSNDPVGKTFSAQLANDVVVAGKVVLRAGTKAARWIHDFGVSNRVQGDGFNFSASLKF